MDAEVLRVVMEIVAFFAVAAAGIWGFPFAGFGMAALGIALRVPAADAHTYAEFLEALRCDEACDGRRRGWQFTEDAWQWTALLMTAWVGVVTLWLSIGLAVVAATMGAFRRASATARRVHLLAAVAMAVTVASFGAFAIIVAPLGERYGI